MKLPTENLFFKVGGILSTTWPYLPTVLPGIAIKLLHYFVFFYEKD
jgi:hypothetical protein